MGHIVAHLAPSEAGGIAYSLSSCIVNASGDCALTSFVTKIAMLCATDICERRSINMNRRRIVAL